MAYNILSAPREDKSLLTQSRLKKLVIYDPKTGLFIWRPRPVRCKQDATWNAAWASKEAGTIKDGYVIICIDYKLYRAHRLAVLYVRGRWPKADVYHDDRVRSNNRWTNITEASRSQNLANGRHKRRDRGVRKLPTGNWQARISVKGNNVGLGTFKRKYEAVAAYKKAATAIFGKYHKSD
jgi:hypothetical protein